MSENQFEIVIEGHVDFVKGLLRGIAAGAKSSSGVPYRTPLLIFLYRHLYNRQEFRFVYPVQVLSYFN